jgi:hypothetical protein
MTCWFRVNRALIALPQFSHLCLSRSDDMLFNRKLIRSSKASIGLAVPKAPEKKVADFSPHGRIMQTDFERAPWVWQRRRWLACILTPAVAAPFLHLRSPFGDVLLDASFVAVVFWCSSPTES